MKDIDGVLTGFDSMLHFLEYGEWLEDYESVWELDSYKVSMSRHLIATIPSFIFTVFFSFMLYVYLSYSPYPMSDFAIPILLVGLIVSLIYFILSDIDKFRIKHDRFIKGNVVGTTRNKSKFNKKYYLVFLIDDGSLIVAEVIKSDYLEAKLNKEYFIFLEGDGLHAIKS